nr:T9SS type A sorting domain-containing protein [Salinivirgaceae bacterium]
GVIEVPDSIDVTVTKYAHMKVWKPRISAVKLKIEAGGISGDSEIESMSPQTVVNEWQDMVFDYSASTGKYFKIVPIPDFADPVDLTDTIYFYIDDIYFSDDPPPEGWVAIHESISASCKIYPNPVENTLYIDAESMISNVSIYTLSGVLLENISVNSLKASIDVSAFTAGIYLIAVKALDYNMVLKFNKIK